jgi:uncharacterized membrane protein YphA (DoxX/SURF4 family)
VLNRYAISTATVVMLVVLRLNIGWHFFAEGVHHCTDPSWTSEPVLRAATGPLAPWYHAYLPDFHDLEAFLHDDTQSPSAAVDGWLGRVEEDWNRRQGEFAGHYDLDAAQQKKAAQVARDFQGRLRSWAGANGDALEAHVHQWRRMEAGRQAPDAVDVPFRKQRLASMRAGLAGEAKSWRIELAMLELGYERELNELLTDDQRSQGAMARPKTAIDAVDVVMKYVILAIGVLLMLGLFTRTASLVGALFLLSVVMTQPFWVSESQPTFNQYVEMFALVTLATTHVGRWGGLDFFVHRLVSRRQDAFEGQDR